MTSNNNKADQTSYFFYLGGQTLKHVQQFYNYTPATAAGWLAVYAVSAGLGLLVNLTHGIFLFLFVSVVALLSLSSTRAVAERVFWWYTLAGVAFLGVPALCELGTSPVGEAALFVDDLSRSLLALTGFVFPVVSLISFRSIVVDRALYVGGMILIETALVVCFFSNNLLVFYIAFEVLAFPMFIQIGRFGSNDKARRRAAFKFFIYTLIGSATALPGMMILYRLTGSLQLLDLQNYTFNLSEQTVLAFCFSVPFFVKMPVMPLHLWLVEAHVEAPAPSSMVLAGLLLKTGGYGYIRWVSSLYSAGTYNLSTLTLALTVCGATLASLFALVQTDLKRMMAYSSVSHMCLMCVALVFNTPFANQGAVYTMLAHGFAATGLFAGVGILYDRYHTRDIRDFGGLASTMPRLAVLFFILILANFGFPFTGNFVGEFITLGEIVRLNLVVGLLLAASCFVALVYSMWVYNRVFFGQLNGRIYRTQDLYSTEEAALVLCVAGVLVLGFTGGVYCEITSSCYTAVATTFTNR